MIEKPDHTTGTSYAQQERMVRFLGEQIGASIHYEKVEKETHAIVKLPDGTVKRFNVYGWEIIDPLKEDS